MAHLAPNVPPLSLYMGSQPTPYWSDDAFRMAALGEYYLHYRQNQLLWHQALYNIGGTLPCIPPPSPPSQRSRYDIESILNRNDNRRTVPDQVVPLFPPVHYTPLGYPTTNAGKRKRRHRTIFTDSQLEVLESHFKVTHYPDITRRDEISKLLNLKEERVEVWFKNRRAKQRKLTKDIAPSTKRTADEMDSDCDDVTTRPTKKPRPENEDEIDPISLEI